MIFATSGSNVSIAPMTPLSVCAALGLVREENEDLGSPTHRVDGRIGHSAGLEQKT